MNKQPLPFAQSLTFKERWKKFAEACIAEKNALVNVWTVFKQEMADSTNAFRQGVIQAEFKQGVSELFDRSNYQLGFMPQDLHNGIKVDRFKDRSRTFANGRIIYFDRKWANRWGKTTKSTQLLRVNGQIVPRDVNASVDGVNYPPRFKFS